MAGLRTATFVAFVWIAAPSALAADGASASGPQVAAFTQSQRLVAPAPPLPGLIDAVLRYAPKSVAEGKGTPRPFEPLHWTAITNDPAIMEELLSRGADPDARDAEGRTPLMVAAAFDSRAVADVLLKHGADLLTRDAVDGNTALDFAAMAGNADFTKLLLTNGAPADARATRNGETPLHYAAYYGRRKVIDLLVESGANINAADYSGVRPLQYARRQRQGLAVEQLLDLGARPDNLHDAVNAGDVARTQALIAGGADVNAYDLSGSPLHLAVSTGQTWIAAMLIDAGADLEAVGEPGNARPLHLAAVANHTEAARLLIDRGAAVDSRDSQARTPLSVAAIYGNSEVAEELILGDADTLAGDVYSDTPLHQAAMSGDTEMVDLLLSHGVDVNLRSGHDGESPLNYAACNGNVAMVAFLLARGADMNMRDDTGRTPLQIVLDNSKSRGVVDLLLRLGAER